MRILWRFLIRDNILLTLKICWEYSYFMARKKSEYPKILLPLIILVGIVLLVGIVTAKSTLDNRSRAAELSSSYLAAEGVFASEQEYQAFLSKKNNAINAQLVQPQWTPTYKPKPEMACRNVYLSNVFQYPTEQTGFVNFLKSNGWQNFYNFGNGAYPNNYSDFPDAAALGLGPKDLILIHKIKGQSFGPESLTAVWPRVIAARDRGVRLVFLNEYQSFMGETGVAHVNQTYADLGTDIRIDADVFGYLRFSPANRLPDTPNEDIKGYVTDAATKTKHVYHLATSNYKPLSDKVKSIYISKDNQTPTFVEQLMSSGSIIRAMGDSSNLEYSGYNTYGRYPNDQLEMMSRLLSCSSNPAAPPPASSPVPCNFYAAGGFTNVAPTSLPVAPDILKSLGATELGRYFGSTKKTAFESLTSLSNAKFLLYYTLSGTTLDTVSPQVNKYLNQGGKVLLVTDGMENNIKFVGAANKYLEGLGLTLLDNQYSGLKTIGSSVETRPEFSGLTSMYISSASQIARTRLFDQGTFPKMRKFTCQYGVNISPKPTYCIWGEVEFENGATLDIITSAASMGYPAQAKPAATELLKKYKNFACPAS